MEFLINEILLEIISWLKDEDLYILRLANKRISNLIDPTKIQSDFNMLLSYVVRYDNKNLWKLVKEWTFPNYDQIAKKYNKNPRKYQCEWEVSAMCFAINNAAFHGNVEFCFLAKKWGHLEFNELLVQAAFEGSEELVKLALDLGANDVERMLQGGSGGNHLSICRLAKKLGAKDFDKMAEYAYKNDNSDCLLLALAWGADSIFADKIPTELFGWGYGFTDHVYYVCFDGKEIPWEEIK